MATVKFEKVNKVYPDGHRAIRDLTLDIEDGEFMVFVGPSGCGKSTALRMVAGLEDITTGQLSIGDRVVNDDGPSQRDIAMVFQSYALYPNMTVYENMGFGLKMSKTPKDKIDRAVREAAKILDMSDLLDRKPKALSGGQQQRVAMGRAIVRNPTVFLMDEPLSNLDAKLRAAMRSEIASLQDRLGVTTIYVTHDQTEAMTMGHRVAVIDDGVLQQVARPQDLYDRPANLFVAGFMGSPAMNLVEGHLGGEADRLTIRIGETHAFSIPTSLLALYPAIGDHVGRSVAVGMRPEDFYPATDSTSRDQVWERRKVTLVERLGSETLVHFATTAAPIAPAVAHAPGTSIVTARFGPHIAPASGDVMDVALDTTKLHFFDLATGVALR